MSNKPLVKYRQNQNTKQTAIAMGDLLLNCVISQLKYVLKFVV